MDDNNKALLYSINTFNLVVIVHSHQDKPVLKRATMDLRDKINSPKRLEQAVKFVRDGTLFYQPFILHDDLHVGEGRNFCKKYKDVEGVYDYNVYSKNFRVASPVRRLVEEADKDYFIQCNRQYDGFYDFYIDKMLESLGEPVSELSFAEIGCNTGISLLKLAEKGAKSCAGYDWSNYDRLFEWYTDLFGIDIEFTQCVWDNLHHRLIAEPKNMKSLMNAAASKIRPLLPNNTKMEIDAPEVDVMINTIYTNHQFDPLQFIAYCCDRSRKGVFFWTLISGHPTPVIEYSGEAPHPEVISDTDLRFPLNYNNGTSVSEPLLRATLNRCGFSDIEEWQTEIPPEWEYWLGGFRMFFAKRTSDTKSAFWEK